MGGYVLDSAGSGWSPLADCFEHGNERLDYARGREFMTSCATISFTNHHV